MHLRLSSLWTVKGSKQMAIRRMLFAVLCPLLIGGCALVTDPAPKPEGRVQTPVQQPRSAPQRAPQVAVDAEKAFTQKILKAAATNGVITKAAMRDGSELGVVLGKSVKLDDIKPLMVSLLKQMRVSFPNRDLTIRAYAPNGERMATMNYDNSAPADQNVTYDTAGF